MIGQVRFSRFSFDQFLKVDYAAFNALSLCGKFSASGPKSHRSKEDPEFSTIFSFYARSSFEPVNPQIPPHQDVPETIPAVAAAASAESI